MRDVHMIIERIDRFIHRLSVSRYREMTPLSTSYMYDQNDVIHFDRALSGEYHPISPGEPWGEMWGSAWFRFHGTVPQHFAGSEVIALINIGAEGCVYMDGVPWQGICIKEGYEDPELATKRIVPLFKPPQQNLWVSSGSGNCPSV